MDISGQLLALIQNLAFILSLGFLYSVACRLTQKRTHSRKVVMGLIFGVVGVLQMFTAIQTSSGIFIDGRVILVTLSVLVGGLESGLITTFVLIAVRVIIGEPGVALAVGAIATTLLLTLAFRSANKTPFYALKLREQLVLLLIVYVSSMPWVYLIPDNVSMDDSLTLVLTGATLYPLILFLSLFILKHEVNHQYAVQLREQYAQELRELIELTPIPIALLQPETYAIIYANRLFKNGGLTDNSASENQCISVKLWQETVKNLADTLPISNHEIQITHDDGSISWILCSVHPETFEGQAVLMTQYQDITASKRHETEILTIVENSPDAIVRYDRNMRALYNNSASQQILGPLFTASHESALKILSIYKEHVTQVLKDGQERSVDCTVNDGQGKAHHLEVRFVPEYYKAYATDTVLCITRDVTEHRQMQKAIARSEEMYRTILSNFPNGLVVLYDEQLRCILLNGTRLTLSNFAPEEAVGHYLEEIFPQALFLRNLSKFNIVFENISAMSEELIHDGHTYEILVVPVYNTESDKIIAGMGIIQDISERKRIENRVRKSEMYYRNLYESVSDAILIFRPQDEVVLEANDRALEMYGFTREEFIGMSLADISVNPAKNDGKVEEVLQKGSVKNMETVQFRKDGSKMILTVSASRTVYNDEPAILTVNRDITLQREREQQELDYAIVQEQTRVLSDFIREAAHEFRTPLSTIYVNLHMLKRKVDPELLRFVESINHQSADIVKLVDSLLLMARLDSDTVFNLGKIDINATVRSILMKHQQTIETKALKVNENLNDEHPTVLGDQQHLGIAIEHVIDNALRFSAQGDTIDITVRTMDGEVRICVEDQAQGMDETVLARIFDRFYRVDSAHTTRGFGLGLPISRKIIEKHGGSIEAESQLGQGSIFIIHLPSSDSILKQKRK